MIEYKNVVAKEDYPTFLTKGKEYRVEVLPEDQTGEYQYEAYRVNTDDGGFRVMKSIHFE